VKRIFAVFSMEIQLSDVRRASLNSELRNVSENVINLGKRSFLLTANSCPFGLSLVDGVMVTHSLAESQGR